MGGTYQSQHLEIVGRREVTSLREAFRVIVVAVAHWVTARQQNVVLRVGDGRRQILVQHFADRRALPLYARHLVELQVVARVDAHHFLEFLVTALSVFLILCICLLLKQNACRGLRQAQQVLDVVEVVLASVLYFLHVPQS